MRGTLYPDMFTRLGKAGTDTKSCYKKLLEGWSACLAVGDLKKQISFAHQKMT